MLFVLVRPRDPNNIGAAARAMANFGLDDLAVVDPWEPVWREARAAVGAAHVLERAIAYGSLAEAIGDREIVGATTAGTRRALERVVTLEEAVGGCALVGATTAGQRRALERVVTPAEFFDEVAREGSWARAALVFGNEKHGLAAEDVERCHVAVRIPTETVQPSMNLAAAVAVCAYQSALARGATPPAPSARRRERGATIAEIEALVMSAFPPSGDPRVERRRRGGRARLRALLLRARATPADLSLLRGRIVEPESDND